MSRTAQTSTRARPLRIVASNLPLPAQQEHWEWLLDEALRETFPASDPIAVTLPAAPPAVGRRAASP
jgi:hypothetical protein